MIIDRPCEIFIIVAGLLWQVSSSVAVSSTCAKNLGDAAAVPILNSLTTQYGDFFVPVTNLMLATQRIPSYDEKELMDRPIKTSNLTKFYDAYEQAMALMRNDAPTEDDRAGFLALLNEMFEDVNSELEVVTQELTDEDVADKIRGAMKVKLEGSAFSDLHRDISDSIKKKVYQGVRVFYSNLQKILKGKLFPADPFTGYTAAELSSFLTNLHGYLFEGEALSWKMAQPIFEASTIRLESTLISTPNKHILPGSRFREFYYWDSYWIIRGLAAIGDIETMKQMVQNYAYLVEKIGFIPNGARTYYLDRSQPPLFAESVSVVYHTIKATGNTTAATEFLTSVLPSIIKEYLGFWMNPQTGHLVNLVNGTAEMPMNSSLTVAEVVEAISVSKLPYLNRYNSFVESPRLESFSKDKVLYDQLTELTSEEHAKYVMRCIRAACESGWDFSSRWNSDFVNASGANLRDSPFNFSNMDTLAVVPADLNAFLYLNEKLISTFLEPFSETKVGNSLSEVFNSMADSRKVAMDKYLLTSVNESIFPPISYVDYYLRTKAKSHVINAGSILADNIVRSEESNAKRMLMWKGGIVPTHISTGQQWDFPNVWPPLQGFVSSMTFHGFNDDAVLYMYQTKYPLAATILRTPMFYEKYNTAGDPGQGGEYAVQIGFGWTIGMFLDTIAYGNIRKLVGAPIL